MLDELRAIEIITTTASRFVIVTITLTLVKEVQKFRMCVGNCNLLPDFA